MKKLILKTALITLACVLVASAIFYGGMCLFAPGSVSNFYYDMGNEELALNFMQKEYEKNPNDKNLKLVTERAIWAKNDASVKKYAKILLERVQEGKITADQEYVYLIAGEYCECLYKDGNKAGAIDIAITFSSGYGKTSPLRKLMAIGIEGKDNQFLNDVLVAIEGFSSSYYDRLSEEAKTRLENDQNTLKQYLLTNG